MTDRRGGGKPKEEKEVEDMRGVVVVIKEVEKE